MNNKLFLPVSDYFIVNVLLQKFVKQNNKKFNILFLVIDILNICMLIFFILIDAWQYIFLYILVFIGVNIWSSNIQHSLNCKYFDRSYKSIHFDTEHLYIDDTPYELGDITNLCFYKSNIGLIIDRKIYFLTCTDIDKEEFDNIIYTARCMMYPFSFENIIQKDCGGDMVE